MKNTVWVSKLSRLMRSLSKSQKRDFKKYVNFWATDSKTTRKYIQLFDVVQRHISSSKEEASLTGHILELQKFGKTVKDVSSLAQYLYLKILESMRTTPDSSRYLNQLNAMEQDLVFLYNKNLFGDCAEIIKRALPLARELDKPALEMEWNFWAYRMKGWAIEYFNDESIREWYDAQNELLANLQDEAGLSKMRTEMRIFLRRKVALPDNFEQMIKIRLVEFEGNNLGHLRLRSRIHLFSIFSDYFDLKYSLDKGKSEDGLVKKVLLEKSMYFQGMALEVYRSNMIFAEEEQANYINLMDAYLNRCLRNKRVDLAEQLEADLAKEKNEFITYCNLAYYRLQRHLTLNEFRLAREYFENEKVAAGIEKYKFRIPENRFIALNFTAGQVYYALEDYDRAGDWFSQVAKMNIEIRPDAVLVCKVLEIICLWEYGAFKSDPDTNRPVRNLRRSLMRARLMNGFLVKVLDAVEMVFRNARGLSRTDFPKLLAEIKNEYETDKTKALFSMVLAWFDAKLFRTSVNMEITKYG